MLKVSRFLKPFNHSINQGMSTIFLSMSSVPLLGGGICVILVVCFHIRGMARQQHLIDCKRMRDFLGWSGGQTRPICFISSIKGYIITFIIKLWNLCKLWNLFLNIIIFNFYSYFQIPCVQS